MDLIVGELRADAKGTLVQSLGIMLLRTDPHVYISYGDKIMDCQNILAVGITNITHM